MNDCFHAGSSCVMHTNLLRFRPKEIGMPSSRPALCAASRFTVARWIVVLVGLVILASPSGAQVLEGGAADSAQAPPPATPPKSRKVYYADVWTPRERTGEINLHGGLFTLTEASGTSPTLGLRLGFDLGSHVLLGVMGDWVYKTKSLLEPSPNDLPSLKPQIVLGKVDAQLKIG